ncbi:putative transcriptional regulator [Sphingomonas sp. UYAg733]
MKVRQNLYIDQPLSDALDDLARRPGTSKSQIVSDALAAYIARRGAKEIDDLLKGRLDRISREIGHARRDIEVLLESLSLFVRYQLTVTAPLPDADGPARAVGRERFEAFVAQVGRQIGSGKRSIGAAEGDDSASTEALR